MMRYTRRFHADASAESVGPATDKPVEEFKSPPVCGVRYGAMNWIGEFRASASGGSRCGKKVVIQSERGIELGEQVCLLCHDFPPRVNPKQVRAYVDASGYEFYRFGAGRILRDASPQDVNEHDRLNLPIRTDIDLCNDFARELELDMKVITAEHLLGGERIVFYFRAEGRIDFRELVRRLAQHYQTRIEMRQVGARDEARLIADYEICGRECCCKNFLKKLRPVTMRMAKLQKSTLDPSKVSGRCGRLRCCLRYENEVYDDLIRRLPKIGATVETASGAGVVIDRQILTQLVLIRGENDQITAVPLEEVKVVGRVGTVQDSGSDADGAFLDADIADAVESGERTSQSGGSRRDGGSRRGRSGRPRERRGGDGGGSAAAAPQSGFVEDSSDKPAGGPQPEARKESGGAASRGRRRRRRPPGTNADGAA